MTTEGTTGAAAKEPTKAETAKAEKADAKAADEALKEQREEARSLIDERHQRELDNLDAANDRDDAGGSGVRGGVI